MLRVNEAELRTFGYGIRQRKRGMGEDSKDIPDVFCDKILCNYVGKVRFCHADSPS
jgi:hypothetical protein